MLSSRTRIMDNLPSVFRQNEVAGENFLGRFLRAFEALFDGLQAEIDAIPDLFTVTPTPVLAVAAEEGAGTVQLEDAAGLCPGEPLHVLDPDPPKSEIVEIGAIALDLIPEVVTLRRNLRFSHARGTPTRVLEATRLTGALSLPVDSGATMLAIADAEFLKSVRRGDALRIDEGDLAEYVQVSTVTGAAIAVSPPLANPHMAGRLVVLMARASTTTPPAMFADAFRSPQEMILTTSALAGETVLELDTISGLEIGDILHLRDFDAGAVEFVKVGALPSDPSGPGIILRFAIHLARPLLYGHPAGTHIGVLGADGGATRLTEPAEEGTRHLTVSDHVALGATPGQALRVDEGPTAEYVRVLEVSPPTVVITPPLHRAHDSGRAVVQVLPVGSGTAFLGWLAGWIGLALRLDRGERWNRELLRRAGRIWPWRGTGLGVEAFLNSYLRGEAQATIFDPSQPLQVGLLSTIGEDTIICGGPPSFFWADLHTFERNARLYSAAGLGELLEATREALRREKPAHTYYDLRIFAHPMQIGVDPETEIGARVGDTTLLWEQPLVIPGDR